MEGSAARADEDKSALRRRIAERRDLLSGEEVERLSLEICRRLEPLCLGVGIRTIALYASIRHEVDLRPLFATLRQNGRTVLYPRVLPQARTLGFFRIEDLEELEPAGPYRIPEPPEDTTVAPLDSIDALVVPGLAFDRQGHRIGWGVGFYDALLPHTRATSIAVGYDFQLLDACPYDAHDAPVDLVVTDRETVRISK